MIYRAGQPRPRGEVVKWILIDIGLLLSLFTLMKIGVTMVLDASSRPNVQQALEDIMSP